MLIEMAGGGAPQSGSAPATEAPTSQEEGEPVYRVGGRLVKRINKKN